MIRIFSVDINYYDTLSKDLSKAGKVILYP